MEKKKLEVFQPYVLTILRELMDGKPKRFKELKKLVKSEQTLTTKLRSLVNSNMVEFYPIITKNGYVNGYKLSKKGKIILKNLEEL